MTFLVLRNQGNICCGHKMFLNKIGNIFCVPNTNLCPQQMLPARANWETFVSATMCPQQGVLVCQGLELDGIGVGRIRTFPFSSDSAMTPSLKLDCRSQKQKRKNQPITRPRIEHCDWFILSQNKRILLFITYSQCDSSPWYKFGDIPEMLRPRDSKGSSAAQHSRASYSASPPESLA